MHPGNQQASPLSESTWKSSRFFEYLFRALVFLADGAKSICNCIAFQKQTNGEAGLFAGVKVAGFEVSGLISFLKEDEPDRKSVV